MVTKINPEMSFIFCNKAVFLSYLQGKMPKHKKRVSLAYSHGIFYKIKSVVKNLLLRCRTISVMIFLF